MSTTPPHAIVLVDDERSYTDLMAQMLTENLDCPVHAFAQPVEALHALPGVNPGVIVTDYNMPQIDGLEFIRQAAVVVPEAVFVLITGHNLATEREKMDRLVQLRGFLEKPFGWRKLADEIIRVWPHHLTVPRHKADSTSL